MRFLPVVFFSEILGWLGKRKDDRLEAHALSHAAKRELKNHIGGSNRWTWKLGKQAELIR